MKLKASLVLAALIAALATVAAVAAPAEAAKPGATSVAVPINSTTPGGLPVVGQFNISSFEVVDGTLTAVGTFVGTIGGQQQSTAATSAITQVTGTCQILDLTLGPLHLDLLGLVIDLNQVHLEITAEQGPGNLLGNLLCAVA